MPVVRGGPHRGVAHQEVAVAHERDGNAAGPQREPAPTVMPGPRAHAAAAVVADVVERMAEMRVARSSRAGSACSTRRGRAARLERRADAGDRRARRRSAGSRTGHVATGKPAPSARGARRVEQRGTAASVSHIEIDVHRRRPGGPAPAAMAVRVARDVDDFPSHGLAPNACLSVPARSSQSSERTTSASAEQARAAFGDVRAGRRRVQRDDRSGTRPRA